MDIAYSYRHVPTIAEFARSDAFIRGLMGPFGSGKSSGCVVEFARRALAQKPGPDGIRRTRWAVVRGTYPRLRDTTIRTFHQWLPPEHFGRWYSHDHRYVVKAFPNTEFEILFRALDRPEDVSNLLSLDLTGAWVNEAREIPWAIIDALGGRCGRYPPKNMGGPTWFGLWMDTNPPDTDSTWYKFFEESMWRASFDEMIERGFFPKGSDPAMYARLFKQPSGLSPNAENLPNLPHGYYPRLAIGKSKEWVKVYIHGRYGFVSDDKVVYDDFNEEVHVAEGDPTPGRTIYRGWDFGLTPCMSLSQVLPNGRWLIFDELISESMGVDRFSDEALEHCGRAFKGNAYFEDYGDPAGMQRAQTDERTCFDILHGKGIMIEPGLQSVRIRLESVRKPLRTMIGGRPQLILHPECKTTRKAFLGGYHYRRMATVAERYTSEPEKNHPYSDIMNAVEYKATILFGAGLTDAAAGEKDSGPDSGYRRTDEGRSEVTGY